MILAASMEFERNHNSEIVERPSDNEEIPQLMRDLPQLSEKSKEKPLCYPYSVKARALLHAHLSRLELPPKSLDLGRQDSIPSSNLRTQHSWPKYCNISSIIDIIYVYHADKQYILKKTPHLLNEMINIVAQLVAMAHAGRGMINFITVAYPICKEHICSRHWFKSFRYKTLYILQLTAYLDWKHLSIVWSWVRW